MYVLYLTGNQYDSCKTDIMWSYLRLEVSNLAAAFCALWKFIKKSIAIVNSACDERMQNHF